jgi:flagellar protein FliL
MQTASLLNFPVITTIQTFPDISRHWHAYCSSGRLEERLMAKEKDGKEREEKSVDESPREAKSKPAQEESPKKKKSKLLFIVLLVMLLGGGAAGAYLFFGDRILEHLIASTSSGRSLAKKAAAAEQKKGGSGGPILTLEPFIFNLAKNSSRFAKVSLAISLQNPKAFEEAKKMVPVLRDKALMVLSAKSAEELIDVSGRDPIKIELQNGLKELFKDKEDLESVYITDIIIP